MPLDAPRPEFRPLTPWPPGIRFLNGPTEQILQGQLPPRPDARSYTGSTAALTADAALAERGAGELIVERRVESQVQSLSSPPAFPIT
jgi:hypothetical protein